MQTLMSRNFFGKTFKINNTFYLKKLKLFNNYAYIYLGNRATSLWVCTWDHRYRNSNTSLRETMNSLSVKAGLWTLHYIIPTTQQLKTVVLWKSQHNSFKLLCCGFSGRWHFWVTVVCVVLWVRPEHNGSILWCCLKTHNTTTALLAFTAVRRAAAAPGGRRCRSISPAHQAHSSKPVVRCCSGR